MTIRSLVFWPHLVAGVSAGLVILMMSVTGVLLTYERQLIAWSDRAFRSAPAASGAQPLPVEALITKFRAAYPDLTPTAVTLGSAPDAPAAFAIPQRTLYLDAYTGASLGEGTQTVRAWMTELRAWHRWIAVEGEGRPIARAITGWSNLIFLFIVVSGLYLWFPRKWTGRYLRSVTWFSGGLKGKARDFNWHNTIGFWCCVPLFIVILCALPIAFPWANAMVYRSVGEAPPAPAGGGAAAAAPAAAQRANSERPRQTPSVEGLNALWARAEQQVPEWRTINMRIPTASEAPVVFAIDQGDGGQPHLRSTLTLERSGDVRSYEAFTDLTLGRRIRNVMRFAHTGEVLGIPGQTVAGIASAGGVVLVWTGLALALRRFRGWLKRRVTRPVPSPALSPSAARVSLVQAGDQR